jgi:hypothetical protein
VPDAPAGGFVEVSAASAYGKALSGGDAGADYVCGLRTGGEIVCWAAGFGAHEVYDWVFHGSGPYEGWEMLKRVEVSSDYGQAEPPEGRFVSVSAAPEHACAVDAGGRVVCWGSDRRHRLDPVVHGWGWRVNNHYCSYRRVDDFKPPPGPVSCVIERGYGDAGLMFEEITSEHPHWGSWEFFGVHHGTVDPLAGPFVEVAAGGRGGCGLRADAAVVCWGVGFAGSEALEGAFSAVAVGDHHACALREQPDNNDSDDTIDNNVVCWGIDDRPPPQQHGCGRARGDDGTSYRTCEGPGPDHPLWLHQTEAPAGVYTELSAGAGHTCAIRQDQQVVCWGDDRRGQLDAPEGHFTQVSAVADSTCGLRVDHIPVCWGAIAGLRPPPGQFVSVTAAGRWGRPCGIRFDGSVKCWGSGTYGEPPEWVGPLVDASLGDQRSCGVKIDGALACWDNRTKKDPYLAAGRPPPSGTYAAVAGSGCGLLVGGAIDCQIRDYEGRDHEPPSGEFVRITRGVDHACAIRADGAVACWGSPAYVYELHDISPD